jgi:hypothetical protein
MDFLLRLRPKKNVNAIHALRRALKFMLRSCGLKAVHVEEIPENGNASQPALVGSSNLKGSNHHD